MGVSVHILLVDNIPDHVISYSRMLTDVGYQVDVVSSAGEALDSARARVPDCIVIDVRLPDMTGWDLCRELKRDERIMQVPIIVLTPDTARDHALQSARALCNAWIAQPSQAEDLVRAVRHVLSQEQDEPPTLEDAVLGISACPVCESDRVRATLRVSPVQYYSCRACGHGWRVEAL
jgi:CheY-like chemotaxis protein